MSSAAKILLGDCAKALAQLEDDSVQFIFTSPPYADQRKKTYGGVHPDKYVEVIKAKLKHCQQRLKLNF